MMADDVLEGVVKFLSAWFDGAGCIPPQGRAGDGDYARGWWAGYEARREAVRAEARRLEEKQRAEIGKAEMGGETI